MCYILIQKGENELTQKLLKRITDAGKIFMVSSKVSDKYFIRFAICASTTSQEHIKFAWNEISKSADCLLSNKSFGDDFCTSFFGD